MNTENFQSSCNGLMIMLILAGVIRAATLAAYPLADNTEARYAEVAREMLATGNWITPRLHGINFWSKPPLSIWLTATTMSAFGQIGVTWFCSVQCFPAIRTCFPVDTQFRF